MSKPPKEVELFQALERTLGRKRRRPVRDDPFERLIFVVLLSALICALAIWS